jgi:hypothetical protein
VYGFGFRLEAVEQQLEAAQKHSAVPAAPPSDSAELKALNTALRQKVQRCAAAHRLHTVCSRVRTCTQACERTSVA